MKKPPLLVFGKTYVDAYAVAPIFGITPVWAEKYVSHAGNYPYPNYDFDRIWNPAKNILFLVGNEILYVNSLQ